MAVELVELNRIPASLREPIQRYAVLVHELAGKNVLALTIHGAASAGTFDPKRHSVRNVLVLKTIDLEMLRRLAEHGAKLGKARICSPLIMTPEYIKRSLDTFGLELIEIKQQHVTILGIDHFDDLSFDNTHVRLQCERELKTILIGLRQGLLAAAGRKRLLGEIEGDVAEALIRTLRGLLWLKGEQKSMPAIQVVAEVETVLERKLPGIRHALAPTHQHRWDEYKMLYEDVAAMGTIVDAW